MRRLIEQILPRWFGAEQKPDSVLSQLTQALDQGAYLGLEGAAHAPDRFLVSFNPEDMAQIRGQSSGLEAHLANAVLEAARGRGFAVPGGIALRVVADPSVPSGECCAVAWHTQAGDTMTAQVDSQQAGRIPGGAFIIIDGSQHVALRQSVISIGRRLENTISLDGPDVSRAHAQIRARGGRYVLFDLGSASGTQVNKRHIRECLLHSGDMIEIGGFSLVYGEDPESGTDATGDFTPQVRSPMDDSQANPPLAADEA